MSILGVGKYKKLFRQDENSGTEKFSLLRNKKLTEKLIRFCKN